MNIPITPSDHALGDFVFRAADRMRIDGCANAVSREGLSLALHCEHEALLDHYLSLVLTRLRQNAPEHSIEVYFPTNTDSLLARFNDALGQQSVKQATQNPPASHHAQIWIVHDAQALPDSEVQLLARLIQNFPGANIRAILLMSGTQGLKNNLSAFGRKILRWDIEAPNAEQSQAAIELASLDGRLLPVQQLIKRIQRPTWASQVALPDPSPETWVTKKDLSPPPSPKAPSAQQKIHAYHAQGLAAIAHFQQLLGRVRQIPLRLALGIGLALTLSTLIMLWMQPEAFGIAKPLTSPPITGPKTLVMPAASVSAEKPSAIDNSANKSEASTSASSPASVR